MVSLYLYLLFSLTDFNEDITLREPEGLALVGIIGVTVIVNMYLVIKDVILKTKRKLLMIKRLNYIEVQNASNLASQQSTIEPKANEEMKSEQKAEEKYNSTMKQRKPSQRLSVYKEPANEKPQLKDNR
jgi:hypothetical protein